MNTQYCLVVLVASLTFNLNCHAVVSSDNILDQIAGYWQFDEISGNVAQEASGQGVNGTLVNYGGAGGNWVSGKMGGALEFGGLQSQQYVHVPDFNKPTGSLTLSAWIWADSFPQWATIAANWNGLYGAMNYGMFGSNPYLSFYFADTGGGGGINVANGSETPISFPPRPPGPGSPALSLGEWHHVAVVADPITLQVTLWRDGSPSGRFHYSGSFYPAPVSHLNIGGEPTFNNPNQGYWDGKIDDMALWTRTLSDQEIGAIYEAGLAGQPLASLVPEPQPIALVCFGLGIMMVFRARWKYLRV